MVRRGVGRGGCRRPRHGHNRVEYRPPVRLVHHRTRAGAGHGYALGYRARLGTIRGDVHGGLHFEFAPARHRRRLGTAAQARHQAHPHHRVAGRRLERLRHHRAGPVRRQRRRERVEPLPPVHRQARQGHRRNRRRGRRPAAAGVRRLAARHRAAAP